MPAAALGLQGGSNEKGAASLKYICQVCDGKWSQRLQRWSPGRGCGEERFRWEVPVRFLIPCEFGRHSVQIDSGCPQREAAVLF